MLYLGSYIKTKDNSGSEFIQIINLKIKKTYTSSFLKTGSICLGVIKKDKINFLLKKKSLKKKMLVNLLIVNTKKKTSRKNGFYIQFNENIGIPYEYKNKRLQVFASRVYVPVPKELKKNKKYKHIVLKAKKSL